MSALAAPPTPRLRVVEEEPQAPRLTLVASHGAVLPSRSEACGEGVCAPTRARLRVVARGGRLVAPLAAEGLAGPARDQGACEVQASRVGARSTDAAALSPLIPHTVPLSQSAAQPLAQRESRVLPEVPGVVAAAGERAAARSASAADVAAAPAPLWMLIPVGLRRLMAVGVAVLVLVAALAIGIGVSGFFSAPVAGGTATVQSGQSLWDIAAATGSDDVAQTVADIVELNGLEASTVQPGQQLILPAH